MILQALTDYYRRKCDDPDPAQRLPAFGLEQKEIPFILEINAAGELLQLRDTRELQGKKKVARIYRVPMGVKKTSGVAANLLWDTLEYVLGVDTKGKPSSMQRSAPAWLHCLKQPAKTPVFKPCCGFWTAWMCPSLNASPPGPMRWRATP